MSEVAWIVGSLLERDAALELLSLEGEAEPRDELGVGPLRDLLADAFFPGVTTLQTRAKYFLFVPKMYRVIEKRRRRQTSSADQVLELERDLLLRLRRSGDWEGAIGSQRWRVPDTPSSAIYWTGLYKWRIRNFSDPRPRYLRWLDSGGSHAHLGLSEEDVGERVLWHEFIDSRDILTSPVMTLTGDEADFLRGRILAMRDARVRPLLKDLAATGQVPDSDFLWEAPVVADRSAALSAEAHDAERLSIALHGAMLLYNYRCAQLRDSEIWIDAWALRNQAWWSQQTSSPWTNWNLDRFWRRAAALPEGGRAISATRPFVDAWVGELRRASSTPIFQRESARQVVERRERQMKRGRARLLGGPALQTWDGTAGVGADPMRFRWSQAARILHDLNPRASS